MLRRGLVSPGLGCIRKSPSKRATRHYEEVGRATEGGAPLYGPGELPESGLTGLFRKQCVRKCTGVRIPHSPRNPLGASREPKGGMMRLGGEPEDTDNCGSGIALSQRPGALQRSGVAVMEWTQMLVFCANLESWCVARHREFDSLPLRSLSSCHPRALADGRPRRQSYHG